MPTYIFSCECGKVFDEVCLIADRKSEEKCSCGKMAQRDIGKEQLGGLRCGEVGFAKHISESMAVHPSDIAKTIEEDRQMGSMASDYLADGRLAFSSHAQLRNYQRVRGMIDKNSFYG